MRKQIFFISISVFVSILMLGCQSIKSLSPDEVLKSSVEQPVNIQYYGESTTTVKVDGQKQSTVYAKEWRASDVERMELFDGDIVSTSVTNGEETLYFEEGKEVAQLFTNDNYVYHLNEPKEEMDGILNDLYKTHTIQLIGDETIAKRKTFHLLAEPNDGDGSNYNIWIDKQYWVILRMEIMNDDYEWTFVYDEIEFNPKFPEDIFLFEPPAGYAINIADLDKEKSDLTILDAKHMIGDSFVYFPSNDHYELQEIDYRNDADSSLESTVRELIFTYVRHDGVRLMELTIVPDPEDVEKLPFKDRKTIRIRGQDISFVDGAGFVSWREDGYLYMIDFFDVSITEAEIEAWTSEMIHPQ